MNLRTVGPSLFAVAALSIALVACGGGKSSADKTKAATAGTPAASSTVGNGTATGKTPSATASANKTPGAIGNETPGATVANPGGSDAAPGALFQPDVTVNPDGTATNSQGTPVVVPTTVGATGVTPALGSTPAPATTPAPGVTVAAGSTPGPNSGAHISIDAPATASGDFTVTVRVDGVSDPYLGFNVFLTFDPSVVDADPGSAGTALASSPDQFFCAKAADKSPGVEGLGCTLLGLVSSTNSGVLATFNFRRIGAGSAHVHLKSLAEGAVTSGTYLVVDADSDPQSVNPVPAAVPLTDATVTVS